MKFFIFYIKQAYKLNENNLYSQIPGFSLFEDKCEYFLFLKIIGFTPQIGNVGKKQISDLFNKITNDDQKNNENNYNKNIQNPIQNESFNDYQTLDVGFHKELPLSRSLIIKTIFIK